MRRIAAALLVLFAATPIAAQDGLIERTLERQLSTEDRIVQIDGFDGALSSEATIARLSVSDRDGIWLSLEEVVIDWNRSALLRGRVEVDTLRAARIEISRAPQPPEAPAVPAAEATPFRLPDLPVSIRIGEVSADRVILGEPLFGVAAELAVEGSLQLAGGEGEGRIEAQRLDGPGGLFRIATSYSNASEILSVEARIEEPEGGVLAHAIGLPGEPAILLEAGGTGPLSDFQADLTLATDGTERVSGTFRLAGAAEEGRSFSAELGGDVAPLFLPSYRDFFGPEVRLAVEGSRSPDGALRLPQLLLTTAQLRLEGSVAIGADGLPDLIDLEGAIADAGGGPVLLPVPGEPLRVRRADLDISFDASQSETWTGHVVAEGVERPGLAAERIALTGSGVIRSGETAGFTGGIELEARVLDLGSAEARAALGETVTASASVVWVEGAPLALDDLRIAGETYGLSGSATVDTGDGISVRGDVAVEARDLSVFAGIAGRPLSGRIDAQVGGLYQPLSGLFDVTMTGIGRDVTVGQPELDTLLGGEAEITLDARRDATGTEVRTFRVVSEGATAEGAAGITNDLVTVSLDAALIRADVIAPGVSGPIVAHLRATGPRDDLSVIAEISGPDIAVFADAVVVPSGEAMAISGTIDAAVADLAPFSARAGRPLAGSIDLTASGSAATDLSAFDLAVQGDLDGVVTGIAQVDALLEGQTTLDAAAVREGGAIRVPRLIFESPALDLDGTGQVQVGDGLAFLGGEVRARATLHDTAILVPGLPAPVTATIDAEGEASRWTVKAELGGEGLSGSADTVVDLSGPVPVVDGTIALDIDDLAPFAEFAGRPLDGAVDATVSGRFTTDLSGFDVDVRGTALDLVTGVDRADQLLAGRATLAAAAVRDGQQITVTGLAFDSPQLLAAGDGSATLGAGASFSLDAARIDATATVRDTRIVAPGLPGPVDLRLTADGAGAAWDVDARFEGPDLAGSADVAIDLSGPAPAGSGTVALDAADIAPFTEIAGRPLSGAIDLSAEGFVVADLSRFDVRGEATSSDLRTGIARADALLAGRASLAIDAERAGGDVTVSALRFDSPALLAEGSGHVTVAGTTPTGGDLTATATLRRPEVVAPGLPGPIDLRLQAIGTGRDWTVEAAVAGPDLNGTVDATVDFSGPAPAVAGRLSLASGDIAPFSALAGRPLGGGIEASVEGALVADLSRFDVAVDATTRSLRVGQPDADALLAGTAQLSLQASRDGGSITVPDFRFESPALTVTGQGQTGGDSNAVTFEARLADISRYAGGIDGPATISGRATQSGGGDWQLDIDASGPSGIGATVTGAVAPSFDRLDLGVRGAAPLEAANAFIAPRLATGTVRFDLRVQGPPALSSVSGQVSTNNARLVAPTLGIALRGIDATVTLGSGRATLDVDGRFDDGGRLLVAGPVTLSGGFPAELTITLRNAVLRDPALYETRVDGGITIVGLLTGGARIAGSLTLDETELRIPSGAVGGATPIPDLVHVAEPASVRLTRERAGLIEEPGESGADASAGPAFPLDLTVTAPNRIFLRGRGLEAELGGAIRLTGTTRDVIPSGRFELIRGRLDILGQRLTLDEGFVNLQGDFNPFVELVAATEADDTLLRIVVRGPASSPEILFLSEPDLPQDEILARLLFGRSISEISPLQAAQLAAAVATLAGRGGEGIVSRLRQDFGLDDLDVTTTEEGGVGVRAGKYIAENVYTDVQIGSEGGAEVSINLDLTPSVTVRGSIDNVGQSGIGVFFERDY